MDKIHALTTSENDTMILLFQKYTYKRRKIRKGNYLFKQLNNTTATIQFKKNKNCVTDLDGDFKRPSDGSCQVIIKDIASNISFHNIYLAITHMDFGRLPVLSAYEGALFIINTTRNTVTLMYDDRGCDLISFDMSILKQYYEELSDLILNVNRSQILESLKSQYK